MKLTSEEQECLDEYMENPFYKGIVDNAPSEPCRTYIIHGLIYGFYAGYEPERCRKSLEDGLSATDWRYVKANLAGNNPFLPKCKAMIRLKENEEACRNSR